MQGQQKETATPEGGNFLNGVLKRVLLLQICIEIYNCYGESVRDWTVYVLCFSRHDVYVRGSQFPGTSRAR